MERIGDVISYLFNAGFGGVLLLAVIAAVLLMIAASIAGLIIASADALLGGAKGPDSAAAKRSEARKQDLRESIAKRREAQEVPESQR